MSRVLERLDELYAIGATRVGGSKEEDRAHELAAGWMREAGLDVTVDLHGNLVGRSGEPRVWTGSHLDSVPNGGKFDGALGVVAGIEAVERAGTGTAVAFRDEERGCTGSTAFAQTEARPACFLELHIEQGPVLANAGAPLGIVTGIAGVVRASRTFEGVPGHAGTVPMAARSDALAAAAEYVLHVRDVAEGIDGAVATVGRLEVGPGAVNVIPDRVTLWVDARAPDQERLTRLVGALELEPGFTLDPATLADAPRAAFKAELEERGLPVIELHSGAGHDAAVLALAGVPAGMLFVRSLNGGVSHSPDELSGEEDIALAVDVLTGALLRLSGGD